MNANSPIPNLTIDPGFQSLIPPLTDDERKLLEESVVNEGCRDPLTTWIMPDGQIVLVDGHNRFETCQRLGIEFRTVELRFSSRDDAEQWILRNQLGRRNLRPDDASELRGRLYNGRKKQHGGIRKSRGQNDHLKRTAQQIAEETGVSEKTVRRDGEYADAVDAVSEIVPDIRDKVRSGDVTKSDVVAAAKDPAKAEQLRTPHVARNTGNFEWFTPLDLCQSVHAVMGGIDLDPASCRIANKQVKAKKIFTAEQDGLTRTWSGRVFLNPPYAQPLIVDFTNKFLEECQKGDITEAIVLTNNATETAWYQSLIHEAAAICFKAGRIKFLDASGAPSNAPLQGQTFLYFGDEQGASAFRDEFSKHGECLG